MRKALLFQFLFALLTLAHATGTQIDCEYFLAGGAASMPARHWLRDSISALVQPAPVEFSPHARAQAFQALGLPSDFPEGVEMRVERSKVANEFYWVRLVTFKGELARFPLQVPPVYVWRGDGDSVTVGTLFADFTHGQLFLSVKRTALRTVMVSLGVDLREGQLEDYSNETSHPLIVVPGQDEALTRVEVLRAQFHLRHEPAEQSSPPITGPENPI